MRHFLGSSTSSKTQAIVSKLIPQVRDGIWKNVEKSQKNDVIFSVFFRVFVVKSRIFGWFLGILKRACPFGARPFGARWAGPPLPCVERKYWKSSEEKVSRKTILYFFAKKNRFLIILDDFLDFFEGAPLRGAPGRAPPPVCRAEILKKFTGKSVPENYTLFLSKTTDLVERIRMQFFCPKLIGER